ncbi:MAG TPA: cation-translocating P-type ATPase [Ideonella sp.]|jgi:Cu2+-exporting ATPase|nr:cation-translocating P-type ATPase [Ideonella sp.]
MMNAKRLGESTLRLGGIRCAACAGILSRALRRVDGVVDAQVDGGACLATVRWDPQRTQPSDLVRAVEQEGYTAVPDTAEAARWLRRRESRDSLWRLFVAALCSMQVMMLAAPSYFATPGELSPDLKQLLDWAGWLLSLPVICFSALPFFKGTLRAWRRRQVGMDVPVALGISVAFLASSGAAFDPGGVFGHEVYFDSLTMFVAFLLAGRHLEMLLRHRAETQLEASVQVLPRTVERLRADGSAETVGAGTVRAGDVLRIPAGQMAAADGVLLQGVTELDEAFLTGEARPVRKGPGDPVAAGSVNLGAPALMRVQRAGADTRYEQVLALMREARTRRTATLSRSDRWAGPFLWSVLLLAALAGAWWGVNDPQRAVWVVVSVLIVTCPCALSLAAPSALLSCASTMARRGVLLRRLDAIEGLANFDVLFTDKTGTLTEARLHCSRVERLAGGAELDDHALRAVGTSLAAWSAHPLARSLSSLQEGAVLAWTQVQEVAGKGMQGEDEAGASWRLGSAAWAVAGTTGTASSDARLWLSREGAPVACFHMDENVRSDAPSCLAGLRDDGVAVSILSGDSPARVERVAERLGVKDWHAAMRPEDKLAAVRQAQQAGQVVAMIGDGVNDAPVLAQADVSLAMGEGAWVARAEADGVLLANGLGDIVRARGLARKTLRIVRQNTLWAVVYNAACVPMALMGWLPPWAAGLGMACSSLGVIANSMRVAR